jgi:hypothetical protein
LNIVTEYPAWYLVFCILTGLIYAGILYYKNADGDFTLLVRRAMAVFRFLSVTIISFLLLSPLLKSVFKTSEKPLIILAHDNSGSLLVGKDSAFYLNQFPDSFNQLSEELSGDYEVKIYSFSDKVTEGSDFQFTGKQTDISDLFSDIITRYSNRNVGAMLLASDGLYNKGLNPVYASEKVKFPVYTLALGDTTIHKDAFVRKVNFNRMAFLGNSFPLEIILGANRCNGLSGTVTVSNKNKIFYQKSITFTSEAFSGSVNVALDATEAGLQRYQVRIAPMSGEISTSNNQQDIFIEVLDAKQKIVILSASPHPDVAAMKQAIESNYNYEVSQFNIDEFDKQTKEFDLIILHQIPGNNYPGTKIISEAVENKVPVLFVLGSQTSLSMFNTLNAGIQIVAEKPSFNESLPFLNTDFALFTISNDTRNAIETFPPLVSPFGEIKTLNSANPLFYQQIGSVVTGYPLVLFNQNLVSKTGVIAGEGIWRWRLANYQKNGNHLAFNELLTKIVQFLSVKIDKSFFQVKSKTNFQENEQVQLDAEVYNQSYELINDPDVELTITNSGDKTYSFIFGKTSNAYHLNAGILPVDNYRFTAKVKVGDKLYTDAGQFTVSPLNVESINTVADHNLLFQIAQKHDGRMLSINQMNDFDNILKERQDIKTVNYAEKRYNELVNEFWLLVLIITLVSAEWFLRKRNGAY